MNKWTRRHLHADRAKQMCGLVPMDIPDDEIISKIITTNKLPLDFYVDKPLEI